MYTLAIRKKRKIDCWSRQAVLEEVASMAALLPYGRTFRREVTLKRVKSILY